MALLNVFKPFLFNVFLMLRVWLFQQVFRPDIYAEYHLGTFRNPSLSGDDQNWYKNGHKRTLCCCFIWRNVAISRRLSRSA